KRVRHPLLHFPGHSKIQSEPLGSVLIIGPWNYPFQLVISPLVGAIAAGNTAIIKPSEISGNTSQAITAMIEDAFDPMEVAIVEGGIPQTSALLELHFDYIFYTGNGTVGRIVMAAAAKNLVPVTLELGGKSPCLVFGEGDLEVSARRIVWGKFFNNGQTCVAPDYLIVQKDLKEPLLEKIKKTIGEYYGENPATSQDYGRVINGNHYKRLTSLFSAEQVLFGGQTEAAENYIAPTLIEADKDSEIMKGEIFGPLLPILEMENFGQALEHIKNGDKPLAAYLFTSDRELQGRFEREISSGGMCINDTIVQLSNDCLPFGGVGESGMGAYHGLASYETFSHRKAIMVRSTWLDLALRYPPYIGKLPIIRTLLKWFG
ncbi:MAG: aldehyde dehydrogenase family protein, partial [Halobacteriovoraceae bacterium]|nr:aldehyde dehydrogenase family protein [Halobacteriovoraceae bacterium]